MMMSNRKALTSIARAIVASAFLGAAVGLPQAGFAQQSPGAIGNPNVSEPRTNTQINDPSRPLNDQNSPTAQPNAGSDQMNNAPSNQGDMNNSGYGSGRGAGGVSMDRSSDNDVQFHNRIERYSNDPNGTNTRRDTEYLP